MRAALTVVIVTLRLASSACLRFSLALTFPAANNIFTLPQGVFFGAGFLGPHKFSTNRYTC
jgi:hypothetical protein